MAKTGLILAVTGDESTMALIWRDEAIAVGSGKEIKATLNDIYTWARKEAEIVKHLDELIESGHFKDLDLDWMASRKIGNLGGNIIKATQIRKLRGILKGKEILLIVEGDLKSITNQYKIVDGFETVDELFDFMGLKEFVGAFNAETKQFFLTKKATEIVAFHEMAHLQHFETLGNDYFSLNKLERETHVWKQILANRNRWTKAELNDALNYINRIRTKEYNLKPLKIK